MNSKEQIFKELDEMFSEVRINYPENYSIRDLDLFDLNSIIESLLLKYPEDDEAVLFYKLKRLDVLSKSQSICLEFEDWARKNYNYMVCEKYYRNSFDLDHGEGLKKEECFDKFLRSKKYI